MNLARKLFFLLGLFWPRCTATAALVAAIASVVLSTILYFTWHSLPFMDRVGLVFVACMAIAVVLSLLQPPREAALTVDLKNIDYSTSTGFNIAALIITVVLIALYTVWW